MHQIRDTLWISDIETARTESLSEYGIEHVVTVCQDSVADNIGDAHYTHYSFPDGPRFDHYETFEAAVDTVVNALATNTPTLVHCHAGVSRSASVCIAALATHDDTTYGKAFTEVRTARSIVNPKPALGASARLYINTPSSTETNDHPTTSAGSPITDSARQATEGQRAKHVLETNGFDVDSIAVGTGNGKTFEFHATLAAYDTAANGATDD